MALFTKYHTFYYHQKNITNTQDLRRLLISYVKRREATLHVLMKTLTKNHS